MHVYQLFDDGQAETELSKRVARSRDISLVKSMPDFFDFCRFDANACVLDFNHRLMPSHPAAKPDGPVFSELDAVFGNIDQNLEKSVIISMDHGHFFSLDLNGVIAFLCLQSKLVLNDFEYLDQFNVFF